MGWMIMLIALLTVITDGYTNAAPIYFLCVGKEGEQTIVIDLDKGFVTVDGHQTPIKEARQGGIEFEDGVLKGIFRLPGDLAYLAPSSAFTGHCK